MLNARIRKAWNQNGAKIGLIGAETDLTYPLTHLGTGPAAFADGGGIPGTARRSRW